MKHLSHNTRTLTIGGIIDQDQLKIGTSSGSVAGIFFDNGKENLPGIRYNKDNGWEASVNGIDWVPVQPESEGILYEVIDIEPSHLDANGIVTIQHNLGKKYPIGLDFTVMPDAIEYTDANTLKLDYSSHGTTSSVISKVWFLNSQPSMVVTPGQGGTDTNSENGGEA